MPFGSMSDCSFSEYELNNTGIYTLWYGAWNWMMGYSGVKGEVFAPPGEPSYQTMPDFDEEKKFGFNIVATDYENFYSMYSCSESWMGTFDTTLIYSRETTLSAALYEEARNAIKSSLPFYSYAWQW